MTRARCSALLALLSLWSLASTGCTASTVCDADASGTSLTTARSAALVGTAELSQKDDSLVLALTSRLSDLPELSPPNGVLQSARISFTFSLRYIDAPMGGDGLTQMPRLNLKLDSAKGGYTTSSFPNGSEQLSLDAFGDCDSGLGVDCCPLGATDCEHTVHVGLTRIDDATFPPVQLSWSALASATVDTCPSWRSPSLTLSNEAP